MKKEETLTVGQFAETEKDTKAGSTAMYLVDKHGCPACGNLTKYELKEPTMPAVSTCSHVTHLEKKSGMKVNIWTFQYTYPLKKPEAAKSERKSARGEKPPDPGHAMKGAKDAMNEPRHAMEKNVFFLESCTQKIPTREMLPEKRKCPKCGKKIQETGSSWYYSTYSHINSWDPCRYSETVYVAPSCLFNDGWSTVPFVPRIWALSGELDHDLAELGALYSSRNPPKPSVLSSGKEEEKIERPGYPLFDNTAGKTYWSCQCPICGMTNEIEASLGKDKKDKWVPLQAGSPMARTCSHYSGRLLMRYNPPFYFTKGPNDKLLVEKAAGKSAPKAVPATPAKGPAHPPKQEKEKRPLSRMKATVQKDLFSFFPQEASAW